MSRTNADFTLRSFIERVKADDADALWRITERVDLNHDVTAWAMELERIGRSPVLWFDDVAGYPFPVIANLFGHRRRFALGLGVEPADLIANGGSSATSASRRWCVIAGQSTMWSRPTRM